MKTEDLYITEQCDYDIQEQRNFIINTIDFLLLSMCKTSLFPRQNPTKRIIPLEQVIEYENAQGTWV